MQWFVETEVNIIVSSTPLRITFAGGGSDVNARVHGGKGKVISVTVNVYVVMTANLRHDQDVVAAYSSVERVPGVAYLKNELIRSCLERSTFANGVEVHSIGSLPLEACGLGGSGAAAVGLLNVLGRLRGIIHSPKELAEMASKVEIEDLGRCIGKQDQYSAAYGGCNIMEFDAEKVEVEKIDIAWLSFLTGHCLMIPCLNGIRMASDLLKEQFEKPRDVADEMASLVDDFYESLKKADLESSILSVRKGWRLKKLLSPLVTNAKADAIISQIQEFGGAGKLCGAGSGGYVFAILPGSCSQYFLDQFPGSFPISFEENGSTITYDSWERSK